ncbi:DUF7117 family protein [Halolamina salifodinae]|uniref:Uncharacterized Zn finger protein (UPF0148 family) n=1 Tax=Halolamina salifodinae TaxID=1202767 RepID=A0A8T4GYL1_9EURY|nr:TFIIB-type zinc ribbon-containing protein [Halolamina salifodinae]MBP1988111.1 uncharacterized Zn finger protein (UPF0148 family) [Halolamina salifodinae]
MKIRGERECKNCGTRWSYYETGEATCPDCGSLRSVAVEEERRRHTDGPADLDLTPQRSTLAQGADIEDVAEAVGRDCRAYLRKRGFISGGDLLPLDDSYLAVQELRTAIADYSRDRRVGVAGPRPAARGTSSLDVEHSEFDDAAAERYLLALIRGAEDGERPAPADVPGALTPSRGLAYAMAVEEYRDDVSTYLEDEPDPEGRRILERIREQEKRLQALDGDVAPETAETLVKACRALERYLNGEEGALVEAEQRLDALD